MIHYLIGDATCPIGDGPKIIAHIVNDVGKWGAGFSGAISRNIGMHPENHFRSHTSYVLGMTGLIMVSVDLLVANMYAQHGVGRATKPIRYDALELCLSDVADHAHSLKATVHMPRIGCGLAGGSWDKVQPLIETKLPGIEVFVYDLA